MPLRQIEIRATNLIIAKRLAHTYKMLGDGTFGAERLVTIQKVPNSVIAGESVFILTFKREKIKRLDLSNRLKKNRGGF